MKRMEKEKICRQAVLSTQTALMFYFDKCSLLNYLTDEQAGKLIKVLVKAREASVKGTEYVVPDFSNDPALKMAYDICSAPWKKEDENYYNSKKSLTGMRARMRDALELAGALEEEEKEEEKKEEKEEEKKEEKEEEFWEFETETDNIKEAPSEAQTGATKNLNNGMSEKIKKEEITDKEFNDEYDELPFNI